MSLLKTIVRIAVIALASVASPGVMAQSTMESGKMGDMKAAQAAAATDMTAGEVRKVDKDSKKITIRHGEIKNLDMPGMTMVFQVKDPAVLDKLQMGDKVKFRAEKSGGAIVVTEIEVTK